MKSMTKEEYIFRAANVHNSKYDYSLVEYKNQATKIKIICPEHGVFEQRADQHLIGQKCRKCFHKTISSTTLDFISKANKIHSDYYGYDNLNYVNNNTSVVIFCPKHGFFNQTPKRHLEGHGCKKCARDVFELCLVDRFNKKHNNQYDYSLMEYYSTETEITIVCPVHGNFKCTPDKHLQGIRCRKCSIKPVFEKINIHKNSFIKKATKLYSDQYSYDNITYIDCHTKIEINCKDHGSFFQTPKQHLSSRGCKMCVKNNRKKQQAPRKTNQTFIENANQVHNKKYTYEKTKFTKSNEIIIITCPTHGDFDQKAYAHLRGQGCSRCMNSLKQISIEEFISRSKKVHNDIYDYSLVKMNSLADKVSIICRVHGLFLQKADDHSRGVGCPRCKSSKGERMIRDFLNKNQISYEEQKKFQDCKRLKSLPFDFYLPQLNIIIEFQGAQHFEPITRNRLWGSEKPIELFKKIKESDEIKKEYCLKNNIKLIEITYLEKNPIHVLENGILKF